MDNSIEIDGILFTLLSKSLDDNLVYIINQDTRRDDYKFFISNRYKNSPYITNARDHVRFMSRSTEGTQILNAYRSTSELGIWRLGYLRRSDCGLNKFKLDYVQGTLLHHLLQKLINENFETLPFIPEDESGTKLVTDGEIGEINAKRNRSTEAELLDPTFLQRHKFILFEFPTVIDESVIDNPERKIQLPPFSSVHITCTNKTSETNIKSQLGMLSSMLERNYDIDFDSNELIVTYPFQEINENIWNCVITMYTVQLRTKVPSENNVILVYCKYDMEYSSRHQQVSGCYGIALLKTNESAVNKYGLYSHFIDAGIYICKPIVYSIMCVGTTEELKERECSETYTYAGDRYESVFPYSQLHHMLTTAGMRKRRIKRKSRKSRKSKKSRKTRKIRKTRKSKK